MTRQEHLGKLLAASQLPPATLTGIQEALPKMSLRQVDLLIEALSREQREWDRLEELLFEAQREVEGRVGQVRGQQQKRVGQIVEQTAQDVEHEEVKRLKGQLQQGV